MDDTVYCVVLYRFLGRPFQLCSSVYGVAQDLVNMKPMPTQHGPARETILQAVNMPRSRFSKSAPLAWSSNHFCNFVSIAAITRIVHTPQDCIPVDGKFPRHLAVSSFSVPQVKSSISSSDSSIFPATTAFSPIIAQDSVSELHE